MTGLSCLIFNLVGDCLFLCCRPDMVDMTRVSAQTNRSNLEQAFCVAEQLGVPRLLDPEGEAWWILLYPGSFEFLQC